MPIVNIAGPGSKLYLPAGGGANRTVGDELFVMTNGSGDGPLYGFDSYTRDSGGDTATITITRIASGGPADRPYLQYVISTATTPEAGAGWNIESPYGNPASPTITRGTSLFIRFSYRPIDDYDQIQKICSVNPGGAPDRSITTIRQYDEGFRIGQGLGGGDVPFAPTMTGFTTWRNIQVEVRFPTVEGESTGYNKVWVNSDVYASPTYFDNNIPAGYRTNNTPGEEFLSFCGLHQGSLSSNVPREFHIADFRTGPTFDSSWDSSGT